MGHVQFVSHEETRLGDDGDLLSLFTWILCTAHAYHTTYVGTLYTVSVIRIMEWDLSEQHIHTQTYSSICWIPSILTSIHFSHQ